MTICGFRDIRQGNISTLPDASLIVNSLYVLIECLPTQQELAEINIPVDVDGAIWLSTLFAQNISECINALVVGPAIHGTGKFIQVIHQCVEKIQCNS